MAWEDVAVISDKALIANLGGLARLRSHTGPGLSELGDFVEVIIGQVEGL
jgi:hypothetical protein